MNGSFDRAGGMPVVLLHGWPVTDAHWRSLAPALRAAGMQPLSLTVRGLGDGCLSGEFDKESLADEVAASLAPLELGAMAVVGHDWGATVGYVLAAKHRKSVVALVAEEEIPPGIVAPVPEGGQLHYPDWHSPLLRSDGVAKRLLVGRADELHRVFLEASAGPGGLDSTAVAAYLDAYAAAGQLDVDIALYASRPADLASIDRLRRRPLTAPVLTIGGGNAMGTAVAEAFRQLATDVVHVQSSESGHYPVEQDPGRVVEPIVDFLRSAAHRPTSVPPPVAV